MDYLLNSSSTVSIKSLLLVLNLIINGLPSKQKLNWDIELDDIRPF